MRPLIEITKATVYRGDLKVFDRLSLMLREGEHTAIVGPNGAGKSTLLKLMTYELYPVAREDAVVRAFGREHWNVWELRARMGLVSHDLQQHYLRDATGLSVVLSGYYSSISTWEHQRFDATQQARADELMHRLGIAHLRERVFAHMSTGEQRRFLLARALVHDPQVLLLDEPTSGLDLKTCFQYLDTVRELMRAGKTVVIVTHHIHEIPPEITRVVLMKNGAVVGDGAKPQVLASQTLSDLFETPVRVTGANGWFQVVPG